MFRTTNTQKMRPQPVRNRTHRCSDSSAVAYGRPRPNIHTRHRKETNRKREIDRHRKAKYNDEKEESERKGHSTMTWLSGQIAHRNITIP